MELIWCWRLFCWSKRPRKWYIPSWRSKSYFLLLLGIITILLKFIVLIKIIWYRFNYNRFNWIWCSWSKGPGEWYIPSWRSKSNLHGCIFCHRGFRGTLSWRRSKRAGEWYIPSWRSKSNLHGWIFCHRGFRGTLSWRRSKRAGEWYIPSWRSKSNLHRLYISCCLIIINICQRSTSLNFYLLSFSGVSMNYSWCSIFLVRWRELAIINRVIKSTKSLTPIDNIFQYVYLIYIWSGF